LVQSHIVKEPENIEALLIKGLVLLKLNCYEEAIKCFDAILRIDKNNAFAWYNKACLVAKLVVKKKL